MRKTLREEILSANIKKDSTYDEIINTVDDYCRKHHKNTSIGFALVFYYLFLTYTLIHFCILLICILIHLVGGRADLAGVNI